MKVEIEIFNKDCSDCPFRRSHRGHGECWEECGFPKIEQKIGAYANILWGCGSVQPKTIAPKWCPLGLGK